MQFKFACPNCGQHLSANTVESGIVAPCPSCGVDVTVPTRGSLGGTRSRVSDSNWRLLGITGMFVAILLVLTAFWVRRLLPVSGLHPVNVAASTQPIAEVKTFPTSFIADIKLCHAAYQDTAGAERPRFIRAFSTPGGNADAIMTTVGAMMQRDYAKPISSTTAALVNARAQIAHEPSVSPALREKFEKFAAIMELNLQMLRSSEPLDLLQNWLNSYSDEEKYFSEILAEANGTHR